MGPPRSQGKGLWSLPNAIPSAISRGIIRPSLKPVSASSAPTSKSFSPRTAASSSKTPRSRQSKRPAVRCDVDVEEADQQNSTVIPRWVGRGKGRLKHVQQAGLPPAKESEAETNEKGNSDYEDGPVLSPRPKLRAVAKYARRPSSSLSSQAFVEVFEAFVEGDVDSHEKRAEEYEVAEERKLPKDNDADDVEATKRDLLRQIEDMQQALAETKAASAPIGRPPKQSAGKSSPKASLSPATKSHDEAPEPTDRRRIPKGVKMSPKASAPSSAIVPDREGDARRRNLIRAAGMIGSKGKKDPARWIEQTTLASEYFVEEESHERGPKGSHKGRNMLSKPSSSLSWEAPAQEDKAIRPSMSQKGGTGLLQYSTGSPSEPFVEDMSSGGYVQVKPSAKPLPSKKAVAKSNHMFAGEVASLKETPQVEFLIRPKAKMVPSQKGAGKRHEFVAEKGETLEEVRKVGKGSTITYARLGKGGMKSSQSYKSGQSPSKFSIGLSAKSDDEDVSETQDCQNSSTSTEAGNMDASEVEDLEAPAAKGDDEKETETAAQAEGSQIVSKRTLPVMSHWLKRPTIKLSGCSKGGKRPLSLNYKGGKMSSKAVASSGKEAVDQEDEPKPQVSQAHLLIAAPNCTVGKKQPKAPGFRLRRADAAPPKATPLGLQSLRTAQVKGSPHAPSEQLFAPIGASSLAQAAAPSAQVETSPSQSGVLPAAHAGPPSAASHTEGKRSYDGFSGEEATPQEDTEGQDMTDLDALMSELPQPPESKKPRVEEIAVEEPKSERVPLPIPASRSNKRPLVEDILQSDSRDVDDAKKPRLVVSEPEPDEDEQPAEWDPYIAGPSSEDVEDAVADENREDTTCQRLGEPFGNHEADTLDLEAINDMINAAAQAALQPASPSEQQMEIRPPEAGSENQGKLPHKQLRLAAAALVKEASPGEQFPPQPPAFPPRPPAAYMQKMQSDTRPLAPETDAAATLYLASAHAAGSAQKVEDIEIFDAKQVSSDDVVCAAEHELEAKSPTEDDADAQQQIQRTQATFKRIQVENGDGNAKVNFLHDNGQKQDGGPTLDLSANPTSAEDSHRGDGGLRRYTLFVDELRLPMRPDVTPAETDCEVFAGNLPVKEYTETQLRTWLEHYGVIADLCLLTENETDIPSGYAYIRFQHHADAAKFIDKHVPSITATWSESERLLKGKAGVYRSDVDASLNEIVGTADAKDLWMLSEKRRAGDTWSPKSQFKQLHFSVMCSDEQFKSLRSLLVSALAAFHEEAATLVQESDPGVLDSKSKGAGSLSEGRRAPSWNDWWQDTPNWTSPAWGAAGTGSQAAAGVASQWAPAQGKGCPSQWDVASATRSAGSLLLPSRKY